MTEQQPKSTERINIPETNKELIYKEIDGVRFEEGLSEEKIKDTLKHLEEIEQKGLGIGFREDIRCNLEHANAGSTAPMMRDPLKPYALISEEMTLEEIREKLRERGSTGMYLEERYWLQDLQEQDFSKQRIPLNMSKGDQDKLIEFLGNLYGDNYPHAINFHFVGSGLDDDGRYLLPHLSHIWVNRERVDFPEELKQIQVQEAQAFMPGSIYVVDQKGWRVNKES